MKGTAESGDEQPGIVVKAGTPLPLGAHAVDDGVNIAVFSRHAEKIEILLFASPKDRVPKANVMLDPVKHRTGDVWHAWISGFGAGSCYSLRAFGPCDPQRGLRFDSTKELIDPQAFALVSIPSWGHDSDSASSSPVQQPGADDGINWNAKALVTAAGFDWDDERRPRHSWSKTVIYETHARGLTRHPSAGVKWPGTYAGVIEKIPYFKELGVTAVEFLPIQEFNANEEMRIGRESGKRLNNYWGYSSVAFFAPKASYSSRVHVPGGALIEFKEMVRQLHRADIEVILDIALNHTAEGDADGPTFSFRGLDNPIYYLLQPDMSRYRDYSGCGNTLNCNHPVVRSFILDCLRHWVVEYHVDGFRFDLASILGRDENGNINSNAPLLERIAEDPILREAKLIAEAWDAGGAYQVGSFPGTRWSEWNGRFRDDVRRFWRGDPGMAGAFANRLCGSSDLYQHSGKEPLNSINFVTCHDGFTLADWVSYAQKHNEDNGYDNRDGSDANYSRNWGVEGPSEDPAVASVRIRQIKNMIATLFLARGVPMLLGGDEFGRTQLGNNNAYCQDNELSWYDWRLLESNRELFRFTREMIALRRRYPVLSQERFYSEREVEWFNPRGVYPDWGAPDRTIGCVIHADDDRRNDLCIIANAEEYQVSFSLPPQYAAARWTVEINTAAAPPGEIRDSANHTEEAGANVTLAPYSLVMMAGG